ncbi:MAG: exosortase system-associated protein, TIGR04073 family [Candidatus Omnitrophica bacterium]|nr:exosortase system-associated protein, TIGR04073 family [Candidatus Omnitrophota bacterium]MDD5237865.1 exosortase system-associated protein, TIGR04073 family [Candidatus Omnitrophota bacterium]
MKKQLYILCSVILALSLLTPADAQEVQTEVTDYGYSIDNNNINYENSPVNKLGRGLINTATCWAEVPASVARVSEQTDPFVGTTLGAVEGVFTGILRGITGLFEAVTFVIPPYNKPIMEPEYALKSADDNLREYLW